MNRVPQRSATPSRSEAFAMSAGKVTPFSPGANQGPSPDAGSRMGTSPAMDQQAAGSGLVDGWNFRLLV